MTDWSYSGPDDLAACEAKCRATAGCTCFVHRVDGTPEFPNCRIATKSIKGWFNTARGYNGYEMVAQV